MGDYIDFVPNYTGPFISNGGFQTSVEFGDRVPKDALDALSRLHDSAYAKYSDRAHRMAADAIYAEEAAKLEGMFPAAAGFAVRYGNQTKDSLMNIVGKTKDYAYLGPLAGLVIGAVDNGYTLYDYMLNSDEYKNDVLKYYATDPYIHLQPGGGSKIMGNSQSGNKLLRERQAKFAEYEKNRVVERNSARSEVDRMPGIETSAGAGQPDTKTYGSEAVAENNPDPGVGKLLMDAVESAATGYGPAVNAPPVRRGENGMIDIRDNDGFSYYAYQPPRRRKRKKKRNTVYIDF